MKILVVEDNAKLNEGIQLYLEENNFTVDTAFNGVQAISKVKDLLKEGKEYDVIILDRMMPMKDGIETLREIKNMGIESGIIILTAKDTVEDKVFGLAAGADDYMVKPFNVKELVARIHSLYRRNLLNKKTENNKSSSFTKKIDGKVVHEEMNFVFNSNSNEIILNKGEENEDKIILTDKESKIFSVLLEYKNEVVNKEDILEKIWQESEAPSSRFVDVHMHNLRSKLIAQNFAGHIDTVRGAGYKLVFD